MATKHRKVDAQFLADKLTNAARDIDGVLASLNTNRVPCCSCGLNKAEDLVEWEANRALEDVPRKLREHAIKLVQRRADGKKG